MIPQRLLQLINQFDEMYEAVDDALHAWWKYKKLDKHPEHCLIGTKPFIFRSYPDTDKSIAIFSDICLAPQHFPQHGS